MVNIDKSLNRSKNELLAYFRDRASESSEEIKGIYGSTNYKKQASEINKAIIKTKENILKSLLQKAKNEKWSNLEILECVLMITYTCYIVMIEYRNSVWPYEYMAFSRRIGELWEPFCKICFEYSINELKLFIPPLFSDVKRKLSREIEDFIESLNIPKDQKIELKRYYDKVWSLVTSGEIKLELDLHFEQNGKKYVVDFKSGFGSNEKGNTNRLLLVASVYKILEEDYQCMLLVRAAEDSNNNYFQLLKNSGIWNAYSGDNTYEKIKEFSGFDIKLWIEENINWNEDFDQKTIQYLTDNNLTQYLIW